MITYCGFCGLELYQICFCLRDNYNFYLKQTKDLDEAAKFRINYYQQVLATIPKSAAWLVREPGYTIWRSTYSKWIT